MARQRSIGGLDVSPQARFQFVGTDSYQSDQRQRHDRRYGPQHRLHERSSEDAAAGGRGRPEEGLAEIQRRYPDRDQHRRLPQKPEPSAADAAVAQCGAPRDHQDREMEFRSDGDAAEEGRWQPRRHRCRMGRRQYSPAELGLCGAGRCGQTVAGRDRIQARWHDHHRQRELPERARLFARRDQGQASQHVRRAEGARQRRLPGVLGEAQSRRVPGGRVQADRQGRQGSLDPGVVQSDPRRQGQAVQSRQVCHRHHRAEIDAMPTSRARSTRSESRRP